ncbi:MAG: 2OG-Fe dioxygenase family protein, partial [Polaromonas sp.]|nr:2OG-Fe dioxygenase family protein [Polaromonas sp.]
MDPGLAEPDRLLEPAAAGRPPTGWRALPQTSARLLYPAIAWRTADAVAHRAHWQPTEYNALHGGFERWFDPVEAAVAQSPAWTGLLG